MIYVGMNVYAIGTRRRTEANVTAVRHLYADFDAGGDAALAALRSRSDLPPPSFIVHSSKGKFQPIWNVVDFEPAYAKRLLRYLAYELGADQAVHDLNRVLRLPGFYYLKTPVTETCRNLLIWQGRVYAAVTHGKSRAVGRPPRVDASASLLAPVRSYPARA